MSKNLRLDIKALRKELLKPVKTETRPLDKTRVEIELNNKVDFVDAKYENDLTYEEITKEVSEERIYKYRNLVMISHLVLNKGYSIKRAIILFRVFLHSYYMVCKEGHSGYSVKYVVHFLRTCVKKNTPCPMVDNDEYGNLIRKGVNELFNTIKLYKESYNLSKQDIQELLHILDMVIKNEPLVAVSLTPHNFGSLEHCGDKDNRQHREISSLFTDRIAPRQVTYLFAVVFKHKYTNSEGEQHDSVYTGNTCLFKGSDIRISSSGYIKKEYYRKMCLKGKYNFPKIYINVSTDEHGEHYITNIKDIKKIKKFYNIKYVNHSK